MMSGDNEMSGSTLFYALFQKTETARMFVIEPCLVQRFAAVTHPAEICDGCLSFIGILQQDM